MAKRKIPSGLRKSTTTEAMKAVFRYDLGDLKGTFISIREIFDNGLARCDLYRDRNYTELIIENIFVPLADIEKLPR